jgi:hypothetical protein
MDKSDYRKKREDAEHKRQETAENAYRQQVIGSLERIAEQNQATENQANRADTFHRRVEKLTLRLEGRRFWLEFAETLGLWVASGVGVAAIIISSHDSGEQTKVMRDQQKAMLDQLTEMKATGQAALDSAKVAHESYVASQRAWIGPIDAHMTAPVAVGPLKVGVTYGNTGREPSPTIGVLIPKIFSYADWNNGVAVTAIEAIKNECLRTPINETIARITFPTTGFASFNISYDGTPQNIRDVNKIAVTNGVVSGQEIAVIQGCFAYRTVNEVHRTAFCYNYQARVSDPGHLTFCNFGQAAN